MATAGTGRLTLIGSGELAPSMSRVHRAVTQRIAGPIHPVFIDTPAGFEPNVHDISSKAVAYFEKHLGVVCDVASFRGEGAHAGEAEAAARRIRLANYVFAGPGSPTYAVRHWQKSPVFAAIADRLGEGAEVVMASAAAIASSACALPVYEIYKCGAPLSWMDGCDLLGPLGLRLAIVPHWNNAEGSGYDTRFCYMGERRFEALHEMLDPDVVVLGLDEYTACAFDFGAETCDVMGAGAVTVLRGGEHVEVGAGESFSLDLLSGGDAPPPKTLPVTAGVDDLDRRIAAATAAASEGRAGHLIAAAVLDLAEAVERTRAVGDERANAAQSALDAAVAAWAAQAGSAATAEVGPYVDLLIDARKALREAKAFSAADAIRDGLSAQGIVLEDSRDGTTWRR